MKLRNLAITGAVIGAMGLTTGCSLFQSESESNRAEDKPAAGSTAATPVELMAIADELARFGIESSDPVMLIAAARIKGQLNPTQLEATPEANEGEPAGEKDSGIDFSADGLLDRAATMAAGNSSVETLVASARAAGSRGAVGGPKATIDRVLAGDTDVWPIRYEGNQIAEIAISGDGDTDLDLYVHDENGNLICFDEDYSDQAYCRWAPRWTGTFYIKVKNLGGVYNQYSIATN